MIKFGSLMSAAILVFGLSAGSMAAAVPQSAAPAAGAGAPTADAGAAASNTPKAHRHKSAHKVRSKTAKKTAVAAK